MKGDRAIIPAETTTNKRNFTNYAKGISSKKIADALYGEGILGPFGRGWSASTLHGNRERGTCIVNNKLYIGLTIWNRRNHAKPRHRPTQVTPQPRTGMGRHRYPHTSYRWPDSLGHSKNPKRRSHNQRHQHQYLRPTAHVYFVFGFAYL
ncbi:recombinase family protein [Planktotalea sp.]|uniref:recombinase family protein n=1 Tax=Planktotalea sp. TaxID=2029877 RepID=UPI003432B5D8